MLTMLLHVLAVALVASFAHARTVFVGDTQSQKLYALPMGSNTATLLSGYTTPSVTEYLGGAASDSQLFILHGTIDRFAVDVLRVHCNSSLTLVRTVGVRIPGALPDWWLVGRPQAEGDLLYVVVFDFKVATASAAVFGSH